jgi:hypothetical protein
MSGEATKLHDARAALPSTEPGPVGQALRAAPRAWLGSTPPHERQPRRQVKHSRRRQAEIRALRF